MLANDDGTVKAEDLKKHFGQDTPIETGGNPKEQEAFFREMVKEFDKNGDGEISFSEFKDTLQAM